MAEYLGVGREKIDVVYPGVPSDYVCDGPRTVEEGRPPTIGYVARICAEKGLHRFLDAAMLLAKMPGMQDLRVKVAGYLGKQNEKWYADQQARVARSELAGKVEFRGEVDRDAKLRIMDSLDVLSVPTVYRETKGVSVLEAMARGVPVVQPAHGSFPELLQLTSGGTLVPPGDPAALAQGMYDLLRDPRRRQQVGEAGRQAVRAGFTEEHMARNMLKVYESVVA
jgi:glycosyltransferase involved in cell wall biosynthesis